MDPSEELPTLKGERAKRYRSVDRAKSCVFLGARDADDRVIALYEDTKPAVLAGVLCHVMFGVSDPSFLRALRNRNKAKAWLLKKIEQGWKIECKPDWPDQLTIGPGPEYVTLDPENGFHVFSGPVRELCHRFGLLEMMDAIPADRLGIAQLGLIDALRNYDKGLSWIRSRFQVVAADDHNEPSIIVFDPDRKWNSREWLILAPEGGYGARYGGGHLQLLRHHHPRLSFRLWADAKKLPKREYQQLLELRTDATGRVHH